MTEYLNLDAYQNELTYLNTLRDVYLRGWPTEDRTGVGTRRLFGKLMTFDLSCDRVPLLTTKRIAYKSLIAELVFFMRGETNVKFLQERGCTIWDSWRRPYTLERNQVLVEPRQAEPCSGYLGDFKAPDHALADTWRGMMRRCYDSTSHNFKYYGACGSTVCDRWKNPSVFYHDATKLPHWWYKQNSIQNGNSGVFELDKDYYSANQYGPNTCVWIHTAENNLYTDSAVGVKATSPDGTERKFLSIQEASRKLNIASSTLHRWYKDGEVSSVKGKNAQWLGWRFDAVDLPMRLELIPDGDLGPIYGKQWRDWNGVDQLKELLEGLKNNPTSRRLILNAWNVSELGSMALPPCHVMSQWTVIDGKVQVILYQRSGDMFLGVPFNIASYAIFAHAVAASVGLKASKLVHVIADAHVYDNHRDQVKEQLDRKCLPCNPQLVLKKDINGKWPWILDVDDFEIIDYKHHKSIKAPVAV